jgi:hypothetical protein
MLVVIPLPGVFKMDIEGGELAALRGAEKTKCGYQPLIVFEYCVIADRFGYTLRDVIEYTSSKDNYDIYLVGPNRSLVPVVDSVERRSEFIDLLVRPAEE